jgi:hypothetical protein
VAYTAEIQIAIKGAEELQRLQDRIKETSKLINKVNTDIEAVAGGGVVRSINNLSKTVADAAAAFNEVALETGEAALAAKAFVDANKNLNRGLQERITLLNNVAQEERRLAEEQRKRSLRAAGIVERTQYAGPIGPGEASSVALSSPLRGRVQQIIDERNGVKQLEQALLSLEMRRVKETNAILDEKAAQVALNLERKKEAGFFNSPGMRPRAQKSKGPSFREQLSNPSSKLGSAVIGGGFPALMGGGPGTIAGGALGGRLGGFAGSIGGSAIGQILDQAVQAASKLGNSFALVGNNYSSLREQGIEFTAEIERQVTAAKKLGDYTKAQELTRGAVFTQTGDVGGLGAQAAATAVNELQKAWNGVTKAVQTLLGFLGTPFIFALTAILRAVQGVVALINLILTGVIKLLSLIPGLNGVLNQAYQSSLKGTAEYENQLAELDKQIGAQNQVLALEKSRTAISSQMVGATKKQQKELEKQLKITELRFELERKIAEIQAASPGATPDQRKAVNARLAVEKSIFGEKVKQLEVDFRIAEAKERELEIQKRQESQIRATAMLSEGIVTAATTHLQNQASIASAATSAYLALNDLEMQRATNAGNTEKQYNLQLQRAQLIYQQTVLQVEQEQRKAQLAALSSQIKLKELEATVAQKAAKNEAYAADYAAVELQKQAVQLAYEGVNAAKLIAMYHMQGANAIQQKTVEMAAFNRTQAAGRASGGGGGGGGGGAIGGGGGTVTRVTSMGTTRSLGAATPQQLASQLSAKGIGGDFTEQQASATLSGLYEQRVQKYIDDRAAKGFKNISPTSVSDRQLERAGFAEGGFVTRPTDAMVGEGGQPEYVIPASKMNDAVRRYSAGTRGEAVVSGAMSAGGANSTSNYSNQQNAYYGGGTGASINITTGPVIRMDNRDYVTMTDMQRGMAAAAGASQASMMRSMSRSYATRRSMGL